MEKKIILVLAQKKFYKIDKHKLVFWKKICKIFKVIKEKIFVLNLKFIKVFDNSKKINIFL